MSGLEVFAWGCFGGLGGEGIGWIEAARKNPTPLYLKTPFYWFAAIVLGLIGGFLVLAYSRDDPIKSCILCINIGASAPLIIRALASGVKKGEY